VSFRHKSAISARIYCGPVNRRAREIADLPARRFANMQAFMAGARQAGADVDTGKRS
jgi:hypothetical protein